MKKTDTWRGYSREELAGLRAQTLQNIRLEVKALNCGIQTARRNNITRAMDVVKQMARVAGYFELLALAFKAWKILRKFK